MRSASSTYGSYFSQQNVDVVRRYGQYVSVVVDSVPPAQLHLLQQKFASGALVLHGLLRHENKISVVNFCLRRVGVAGDVVRSKEPLMFLVGSR